MNSRQLKAAVDKGADSFKLTTAAQMYETHAKSPTKQIIMLLKAVLKFEIKSQSCILKIALQQHLEYVNLFNNLFLL